ncbi:MAG TPA: ArsB/NhaD family transporter [bacterium]|nr:ArsB/NhaD family transporter [bacterium]
MSTAMWIGLGLFVTIYVFISAELVNKTIISLLGASLFIVFQIIGTNKAFSVIDWNVIFLLISMMIIVGITKKTGVFQYVAIKAAKFAKGEPLAILVLMSLITALFSALLDNVTTVLIIAPVTILIAVELGISPIPFIVSIAIASNIGGTATLIGDPPNIMIGSAAKLDFMSFIVNLSPIILVLLVVLSGISYLLFAKKLHVSNERKARIMEFDESKAIEDVPLLVKSLSVLGLVIIGFLLHGLLEVEASVIALLGASLLMLLTGSKEVDEFFHDVEWGTLFFFIGLFIMVGGLVELGIMKMLSEWVLGITKGNMTLTTIALLWFSGVLSAFVDNIPYVATMIPLVQNIGTTVGAVAIGPVWWSLALGACLGGNGTLIGASANVVAVGLANKSGYKISFMDFTKYGALITVVNLIIVTFYLYIRYYLL